MQKELEKSVVEMIRVNQAGEYGARRIYQGQMDFVNDQAEKKVIQHMAAQEEEHLKTFNEYAVMHNVRPTLLQPLWHLGGYAMGAVTAALGKEAAHACTIAVEEVIDEHYEEQLNTLRATPEKAPEGMISAIEKFQADEAEHRETAMQRGGESAPGYNFIYAAVKGVTKLAITLSKKI